MGNKNTSTVEHISIDERKKLWNQLEETNKDPRIYRQDRHGNELSYCMYNKRKKGGWKIIYVNPKMIIKKNHMDNLEIVHYNIKTKDNTIFKLTK